MLRVAQGRLGRFVQALGPPQLMPFGVLCALLSICLSVGERQTCSADGSCTQDAILSAERNPYETLGVERSATQATIIKAYRALAKAWHPDRPSHESVVNRDKATRVFAEVADAYNVLSDRARCLRSARSKRSSAHARWRPYHEERLCAT